MSDIVELQGPDGATARVCAHGGQLLSWVCAGHERLYLSPRARHASGQAIRGGVPVIFPQFGDRGPGPRHGFARVRAWTPAGEGRWRLRDDDATRALWPHGFELELTVSLQARALSVGLDVANTGDDAFAFTAALHTYLAVDALAGSHLHGLGGRAYYDAARGGTRATQTEAALAFAGELDRLYPGAAGGLALDDDGRRLRIDAEGFPDTVVWNPGPALAVELADLGPREHERFVCVEAAAAAQPLRLGPGERWHGRQTLTVPD
ncbi:D-hexose-6-phosphate mutarotase [Lysobacter silvisoli]|uniref:Putative glucose-6-phosphate 1-epimerase n=1 Tax=Lysobacter silvisoli TaxID=2293254 RepID=A0A371JZR7_9GAMM|nr:D-hexose-6-phosphate mutarotase [Lysobacter silvisoli]RDZ27112.1 D-hexose-6-phosphate mutarotase [Lysobacter silvisoli]